MAEFKTTQMTMVSRASVKIGESYFTFEASVTKSCPDEYTDDEYIDAKNKLWDEVNAEVDNQIADVRNMVKKPIHH